MKKAIILCLSFVLVQLSTAQDLSKMNSSNTWLKAGINAGVPFGDLANTTSFGVGVDLSLQFLETKASGIGIKVGYLNYFGKDNFDDVSIIPLAILYRHYPESKGWFGGLEVGYGITNNVANTNGGIFVRPHAGIHTDHWNFFAYYDYVSTDDTAIDPQTIGIGITRNIRFK